MAHGVGIDAVEVSPEARAGGRLAGAGVGELLGGHRGRVERWGPGWPPRFSAGRRPVRLPLEVDGVGRRRTGRVAGVSAQPLLKRSELGPEGFDLELHQLGRGPSLDRQGDSDVRR